MNSTPAISASLEVPNRDTWERGNANDAGKTGPVGRQRRAPATGWRRAVRRLRDRKDGRGPASNCAEAMRSARRSRTEARWLMDSAMQRRRSAISANSKKTTGESIHITLLDIGSETSGGGHDRGIA